VKGFKKVIAVVLEKGPWFPAAFPGTCDHCWWRFRTGEMIRADGTGGWQCFHHEDDDEENGRDV
jgi:hypothetical protein